MIQTPNTSRYRVLIVNGHPKSGSFCDGLADALAQGASDAHEVRQLFLRDLRFDQNNLGQELEPSLEHSRSLIIWAQHLVIVYPV
jgi:NAD(P)H dehydrogenase (quinone)